MPQLLASGTQTATISTEHTLATDVSNRNYSLQVDLSNMVNGDTVEIRIYSKVLSGGAEGLKYVRRYKHTQAEPIVQSIPCSDDISFRATLKQTTGTGRSFAWKVLEV